MNKNEIEVFAYLDNRARIEGINIKDLQQLLLAPGSSCNKKYKNYSVKLSDVNLLLLYDNNKNANLLIKCVNNYYKMKETDCYRIRTELGTYNDSHNKDACIKCHLKCINKSKNKEIERL